MKKILLSAVAVAAISVSVPASAQSGILGNIFGGSGSGLRDGINRIDDQIRAAYQRGELSASEARRLEAEYLQLRDLDQRYRQDGLSREERYDLERRLDSLRRRLEFARQNGDGGYDNDDRDYGRNDCPPGLAKKRNGCLPPGQAKKRGDDYRDGNADYRNDDRYQDSDR